MKSDDKKAFLTKKGWFPWYSQDYWCHERFGINNRDCTNYGMSLEDAYRYENEKEFAEKINMGMELYSSSLRAYSNLGTTKGGGNAIRDRGSDT